MIALDTNVLVRFFADDDPAQRQAVRELFASLSRANPGFISQPVLVEMVWVLSRSYGMSRREWLDALWVLVQSDEIEFDDGECVVEALDAAEEGADLADALIHANGRQFQVEETVTFDRQAAKQFGWRLLG